MSILKKLVGLLITLMCISCLAFLVLGSKGMPFLPHCGDWTPPVKVVNESYALAKDLNLIVHQYAWTKEEYVGLYAKPLRLCRGTKDVLIVEMSVINQSTHQIEILDCFVQDEGSRSYQKTAWGNVPPEESLFIADYPPGETRRGKLAFEVPRGGQSLWLYCGQYGSKTYALAKIR